MPNDAKLGLVVGMTLVLAIAVLVFRKEPASAQPPTSLLPGQLETKKPPLSRIPKSDDPFLPPPSIE